MKSYEDIKKILSRPFPNNLIKSRRGRSGKPLRYVEGAEYIRRLNEAFSHKWSIRVVEKFDAEDSIVVHVELTVHFGDDEVKKQAFGGTEIKRTRAEKKMISYSDDYKSAETDALKKACSMLGIGLHLYSDGESIPDDTLSVPDTNHLLETSTPPANEEQINKIINLAKTIGWGARDLIEFCEKRWAKPHRQLNYDQITQAIDMLIDMAKEKGCEL